MSVSNRFLRELKNELEHSLLEFYKERIYIIKFTHGKCKMKTRVKASSPTVALSSARAEIERNFPGSKIILVTSDSTFWQNSIGE